MRLREYVQWLEKAKRRQSTEGDGVRVYDINNAEMHLIVCHGVRNEIPMGVMVNVGLGGVTIIDNRGEKMDTFKLKTLGEAMEWLESLGEIKVDVFHTGLLGINSWL